MTKDFKPDVARRQGARFQLSHCVLPAWRAAEIESISARGSIALAFTGQSKAVVRASDGHARLRAVPPLSVGLGGDVPIAWLETESASDILEMTGSEELRRQIAREMGVESYAHLDDVHGWHDPIIQAIATRLRAAVRGRISVSDLEVETLICAAYAQSLRRHFGGRDAMVKALDARRRQRVLEMVLAKAGGPLSLELLAEVAALSPFHFARSFAVTFGMPPHQFVTIVRLERAFELLRTSPVSVSHAAAAAGFVNLHHFRQLFRRQYGAQPSEVARLLINDRR